MIYKVLRAVCTLEDGAKHTIKYGTHADASNCCHDIDQFRSKLKETLVSVGIAAKKNKSCI